MHTYKTKHHLVNEFVWRTLNGYAHAIHMI